MSNYDELLAQGRCPGPPEPGSHWLDPICQVDFVWLPPLHLWVGRCMVDNRQYRRFKPDHRCGEFQGHSLDGDEQPVVRISFDDAMDFAAWLTDECRELELLPAEYVFRVPSDREWTTFARCGDGRAYPWGDEWPPAFGNYGDETARQAFPQWEAIEGYTDGYAVTCPVAEAGVNPWGLIGVGGNAYEWTFQANGTETELRGGSFSTNQPEYLRINDHYIREPSSRVINFGLRLVLTP